MDFLLILIAIGGFVTAIVMLVLASRANRLQRESDERVETLESMATGAVLFASPVAAADPALHGEHEEDDVDFALNQFADEDELVAMERLTREPQPLFAPTAVAAPVPAYQFVMTVPELSGAGRVHVSFDRARGRGGQ